MESVIDLKTIESIMWLDDEDFEKAIRDLNLKEILCLMESIQTSMCEEQFQFEELTLQLQKYPDRNSPSHRKISAALCTVQSLLTNLCTKHMMCSGLRSLRTSFDANPASNDNTPIVKAHKMANRPLQNGGDRTSGFKESLRFFQSQVEQVEAPRTNSSKNDSRKSPLTNGQSKFKVSIDDENKPNSKITNSVPSVDNILTNVKNLCSSRGVKTVTESNSKFTVVQQTTNGKDSEHKNNPGIYQTSSNRIHHQGRHELGITKSEQVVSQKTVSDSTKRQTLLSSFNPSLEFGETDKVILDGNEIEPGSVSTSSKSFFQSQNLSNSKKSLSSENNIEQLQSEYLFGIVNRDSFKNVSNLANGSQTKSSNSLTAENKPAQNVRNDNTNVPTSRTFSQCKEKLSQGDFNKVSTVQTNNGFSDLNAVKLNSPAIAEASEVEKQELDDNVAEKQTESFESDYDSHDFIVHKATFPDDYLEAMSEDNYSSVNEEYEVEHPQDPDIPSPDYVSDEEEYLVQHNEVPQYEDVEFIDNSAQYANDPRRFIYYPEDKELEVIPEEDEDDIEDEDMFNDDYAYKRGSFQTSNPGSDDSRYNYHGECDSGLTDDQRSISSTAEECDIEDDTDSAKGSLPRQGRQDSSVESPTYDDRANMFQNVEYHKLNKKNKINSKRIIEDYEKPKLKGKNVETTLMNNRNEVDEIRQVRNTSSSWDPRELLELLYRLDISVVPVKKSSTKYINKEGYLEKLPSGRKKATYWNPWKRRYFKLKDGFLFCYDNTRAEKPSMTLQLMGGHIDTLENKMLGVDDQKGHYVVLKCTDEDAVESWENALRSQCTEDFINTYTSPCPRPLSINKNIIIIDLGSCSVRAGILMAKPTMPQIFFPTVCANNKSSHKNIFGFGALEPTTRQKSTISFPFHPSAKVTKYSIDVSILPDLLKQIFQELNVYPEDYKVQLSMPRNLSLQTKVKIARLLLDEFKVKGINLTHQAILSLHGYNSKSGIIVDIGDRLDVIPIVEGYIVESGVTRLPYGGQRMIDHLKHALAEKNINIVSDVETYLARYVLEQLCYVAENYKEEVQRFQVNPEDFEMSISTNHFFNDEPLYNEIILDVGRFHVPEGLFLPEKWGLDHPGLHTLVHHAIQECGVDLRREMTRSIYVSGGVTLLSGFVERLESEVDKLTPQTITPKVHASAYRYHMSYLGACKIALEDKFDEVCITKEIWRKEGNTCMKKWHI